MLFSELEKFLIRKKYGIVKKVSSKRLAVLTEHNRIDLLKIIENDMPGAKYDKTPSSSSSVGFVEVENFKIFAKPLSKQGSKSAGIENEIIIINIKRSCFRTYSICFITRSEIRNIFNIFSISN